MQAWKKWFNCIFWQTKSFRFSWWRTLLCSLWNLVCVKGWVTDKNTLPVLSWRALQWACTCVHEVLCCRKGGGMGEVSVVAGFALSMSATRPPCVPLRSLSHKRCCMTSLFQVCPHSLTSVFSVTQCLPSLWFGHGTRSQLRAAPSPSSAAPRGTLLLLCFGRKKAARWERVLQNTLKHLFKIIVYWLINCLRKV